MPTSSRLQFGSFSSRIIAYLVVLLLVVLGTVFFSVNRSTYDNTRAVIDDNLEVGRDVFRELIAEQESNFKVTFRALVSDFAFRQVYDTRDYNTILTAAENLLTRTEEIADMLMVVDYDYLMVADTLRLHPPETDFPWIYLLEDAEDDPRYETSSFILIDNIAYHIVAVPILTPLVDGWIIVGQRLDTDYVASLKEIISSDVSILELDAQGNGRPLTTTLPENQAAEVGMEFNVYSAGAQGTGMLDLAGDDFVSLTSPLVQRPELNLVALIQQSLPEALAPYRQLEQRLIILFALGLSLSLFMALFLGRSVSKPVLSLVQRVRKIEQGDYSTGSSSRRRDEIGHLENSVDNMATGLAEKEQVRDLLGKVVSREIAEELMKGDVELGGETRTVTILFSDIRDFTSLCEGHAPGKILEMLNLYLSEVSTAIEANKGVVDKYIGDAVMALFGAPIASNDDVSNALSAALGMKQKVDQLNNSSMVAGMPAMKTGIGLHTGEVVAGNLGSSNRMNYTVIGDAVNLASRLEALTKEYGVDILVSENTMQAGVEFEYRELDMVRVKGKEKPVRIFELLGNKGQVSRDILESARCFEDMLSLYRKGLWAQAAETLETMIHTDPENKLYGLFQHRIATCQANPPALWDGVYTFDSK